MRKLNKTISIAIVIAVALSLFSCTAFAANPSVEELQKSVVYIEHSFKIVSTSNPKITDVLTFTGTGFAIGKSGEPVQYIATCNHCVSMPSGVYCLILDSYGRLSGFVKQKDSMKYPQVIEDGGNTLFVDYFETEIVELKAVFSEATNDFTKLSVVDTDPESDIAVCMLSSEPTEKIVARPIKTSEHVKVGDAVYAIGYPSSSEEFNSQKTHDYSDTTVTKGIISKTLMTYGATSTTKQFLAHQIDAQITHGNSGGPLFSEDGCVIGINAFGNVDEKSTKADYAIASDELIKILNAADIPYEPYVDINIGLIIAIVAAVVTVVAVIVILLLKNKNKGQVSAKNNSSEPVLDATVADVNKPASAPASSGGKYYLLGIKGVYEGKKYSIDERVVIGRNKEKCNVVYPDNQPGISGIHCEIIKSGSVLTLKDCGSTYGTFLGNGTKVTPNLPVVLKSGERFWVGDKENIFEVKY